MMKQTLWEKVRDHFRPAIVTVTPEQTQRLRLSGKDLRIPLTGTAGYRIEMGKQILHLYPEVGPIQTDAPHSFILVDPERYFGGIAHLQRISPGDTLTIDRNTEYQEYVFSSPRDAFRRHFSISHTGDTLVLRDPISELGTYVSLITDERELTRIADRRRAALGRVRKIFGKALEPLSAGNALDTLRQVNRLLGNDAYRRKDSLGHPGGILELPDHLIPIVVGDLHARLDNLLKVLSENAFLESLEKGSAALVILGDAVHPEEPGRLAEMESSLLIMDLIFKLKLRFPQQVFYIVGNHDSFLHELMKQGIPQGLLWEKHVVASRGQEYKAELELFYRQSPLLVLSRDFIACHAGPPRRKISRQMLVDVRQFPDIVHDMTWNRIRTTAFPAGYTRHDIRRFRKGLNVDSDIPFIVGHHPYSQDDTLWLNAGQINQHHIVISARTDRVGMFTRVDGRMVPQIYPAEPLAVWLNSQAPA